MNENVSIEYRLCSAWLWDQSAETTGCIQSMFTFYIILNWFRRKMNSSEGAVAYDKEAKINQDQTEVDRNSISNITFLNNNADRSNLHELFPPKLATVKRH